MAASSLAWAHVWTSSSLPVSAVALWMSAAVDMNVRLSGSSAASSSGVGDACRPCGWTWTYVYAYAYAYGELRTCVGLFIY